MGRKTKINIEETAKIMQKSAQHVRLGLQQQRLPFGSAVQKPNGRWSYDIVFKAFCEYMRITVDEMNEKIQEIRTYANRKGGF